MAAPALSVIVPTFGRPDGLVRLLEALARQTLPPDAFEVVVCDDGSPSPVADALPSREWPFALTLLRQANAGPGAARNRAIAAARAPLLVIFNDDAVPFDDVLARHLEAQQAAPAGRPLILLGTFEFRPEDCAASLLQDTAQHRDMVFQYGEARPGVDLHWGFFWTCNLSVPTAAVRAVGGFDEAFPHPMMEDVELGLRLVGQAGARLRHDPGIRAWHDHRMRAAALRRRARMLGWNRVRAWRKHPGQAAFRPVPAQLAADLGDAAQLDRVRAFVEQEWPKVEAAAAAVAAAEETPPPRDGPAREAARDALFAQERLMESGESIKAALLGLAGVGADRVLAEDPVARGAVDAVQDWDAVSGEAPGVLLCAPGVRLPADGVRRLQVQLARWPDQALVAPLPIDRLGPRARAAVGPTGEKLDALSAAVAQRTPGVGAPLPGPPGPVVLVRREALASVGGVPPANDAAARLAALRGALDAAGWRSRLALDVVALSPARGG